MRSTARKTWLIVHRGFINGRTSRDTPVGEVHPRDDMLDFDTSTSVLQNNTLAGYGDNEYSYAYGSLHHLPLGCGESTAGLLLSLMSERRSKDEPSKNGDTFSGEPVGCHAWQILGTDADAGRIQWTR